MIVGTNMMNIYNHRLELIKRLLGLNHQVCIVAPRGGEEKSLEKLGVRFIDTPVDNRGTNPINDLRLMMSLIRVFKREEPDVILTFYTKTNIYGGLAARLTHIPYIENITGLGSAVSKGGIIGKIMLVLYSNAVRKARIVFFQNRQNRQFFHDHNVPLIDEKLLPGSGVSLERFSIQPYPASDNLDFVFISRVLKEKGIYEYVEAAKSIKQRYPGTTLHVIGPYDEEYAEYLHQAEKDGIITVHGKVFNVPDFIRNSHCTVFPSYYAEGMANVLLESAASGRPLITTDMPGCGETVDDGVTGFVVKPQNSNDLKEKIERFIALSHEEKRNMGIAGRKKMEREFDRKIVTEAYISEINKILKGI